MRESKRDFQYNSMIKEFTLGAVKWTVEEIDKFESPTQLGESSYGESRIKISKTWSNCDSSTDILDQTLYHEVTHAILDSMGKNDLSRDEEFVQQFSLLLHQFEKTKK